jgi:glutathione S-transferase
LYETGLSFETEKVDSKTKRTERGTDFLGINPNGYVPVLALDNAELLTEVCVVLQYIADRSPEKLLAPAPGGLPGYRLMEWLSFISTELHKSYGPLFAADTPEEYKHSMRHKLVQRLAYVEQKLGDRQYLLGDQFSVADAYLFVVLNWSRAVGVDLAPYAKLQQFQSRASQRPAVQSAMRAEGLIK